MMASETIMGEAGFGVLTKLQESDGINLYPALDVFIPDEDTPAHLKPEGGAQRGCGSCEP